MKNKKAQVFHFDLYGKREDKYDFLNENSLKSIAWTELDPQEPELFFVQKDYGAKSSYDEGFSVMELFKVNGVGICSKRDETAYKNTKKEIKEVIFDFINLNEYEIKQKYKTEISESRDKKTAFAIENIKKTPYIDEHIMQVNYRPFDKKWTFYTKYSRGFLAYPVYDVLQHLTKENIAIILPRQCASDWRYCFITKNISDLNLIGTAGSFGSGNIFPLYLYPEPTLGAEAERVPNLNMEIVESIKEKLGLQFASEKNLKDSNAFSNDDTQKHTTPSGSHIDNLSDVINIRPLGLFAPIDLLDYIYAVLHSPTYREKYKEFLKIDFPRVPYPKDTATFWQLVKLGGEIRQIHLLESPIVENYITQYPLDGDNVVGKIKYENRKVYINETQYFDNVPEVAWNFFIGGYQPAQKWLKDRKDRKLEFEDILHYQKIIVALSETDRLMKEIDKIEI